MSRPKNSIPSYTFHKPTGQARVRVAGRDFYLGPFGSPESRQEYARLLALHAGGLDLSGPPPGSPGTQLTVAELLLAFWRFAEGYYVKNGKVTSELDCYKSAFRPLKKLYGLTAILEFGPLALKAVRTSMVAEGWTRKFINKSVSRIRRVFRWGVSNELVPASLVQALEAVEPLLEGRTEAHDNAPRHSVPKASIDAVRARVKQKTRDIDLLLATGARPGEILMLTTGMLNRSGEIWVAELHDHKMKHMGTTRRLYFSAAPQTILTRHLKVDPDERLFQITRNTFGKLITDACERAGIPKFTPHWLRPTVATRIRATHGIGDAQGLLGHAKPDMTARYSADPEARVIALMKKIG